ncbi:MAG TPA: hypothetical protein VKY32_07805 [Flavobacterium sp.]|nr:hypothetical protein [Flavobacterium sp.]
MKNFRYLFFIGVLLNINTVKAQDKTETLNWLRNHIDTVVVHYTDDILPYKMTKTYTFYDDNFVVKTVKDFYKDPNLNGAPAYSKIFYKDLFIANDSIIRNDIQKDENEGKTFVYTVWAERVYSILGHEEAPLSFWRTFNEPMGLDLFLLQKQSLSIEIVRNLYQLATLEGAKEIPKELFSGDELDEY